MQGLISRGIRLLIKPVLSARVPVRLQRAWGTATGFMLIGPKNARYTKTSLAEVPLTRIEPESAIDERGLLYLHGGAYVMGGSRSHRKLAAAIGEAAQARVWLPDYRLAPEHPYPAALDDALAVYSTLLEQGQDWSQFSIVGDSAGAGLTLALASAIRDAGLPLPACLVLLSPWADNSLGGDTISTHADRDPMLSPSWLRWAAGVYRATGKSDSTDSESTDDGSPIKANMKGFPPILIQVGSEEILLSDALRVHERATAAGVGCELSQYDGLWHVFQLHYGLLKAANDAVAEVARFIKKQVAGQPSSHGPTR